MRLILFVPGVHKKDFAAGVARRPLGVVTALGDQLPGFIREDDIAHRGGARPGLHRLGPILPKVSSSPPRSYSL